MGIFSRKKPDPSSRRRPGASQSARPYAYYQSRDKDGSLHKEKVGRSRSWQQRLGHLPLYATVFVLLAALLHSSTLTTTPKIIVVNDDDPQVKALQRSTTSYQDIASQELQSSVLNRSKLTMNTSHVAEDLLAAFPEATDVSVVMPIVGRNPIIYLRLAQPALLLKTNNQEQFVVDEQGRAVGEADDITDKKLTKQLLVVEDKSGLNILAGSFVLTQEDTQFMQDIATLLAQKKITVKRLVLPLSATEVHVYPKNQPYYIKMTTERAVREQVGAYLATKQQLAKDGVTPASYIDVRVEGRTYTR